MNKIKLLLIRIDDFMEKYSGFIFPITLVILMFVSLIICFLEK